MPLQATSGSVDITDGSYLATVLRIEETAPTPNSKDDNPWLKYFLIVYSSAQGVEMTAGSSMRFGPQTKTRRWAEALEGRKFETGQSWDYEQCKYVDCQVIVRHDDKGFARITEILPAPKSPPGRPASPDTGVKV